MATNTKSLVGTGADDHLAGTYGADLIRGAAGNDTLLGLYGDDQLYGGAGDDVLDGGAGADLLVGGNGADLFVFGASGLTTAVLIDGEVPAELAVNLNLGHDVVADFEVGTDHLHATAGSNGDPVPLDVLQARLQLAEQDVDADGRLDTVLRLDFVDALGIHITDPGFSITLLGVSGASLAQLFG